MPGYLHSVPSGRTACFLKRFQHIERLAGTGKRDTATYVIPVGVHFWSQENFQRVLPR
jgi:hypothetical protein